MNAATLAEGVDVAPGRAEDCTGEVGEVGENGVIVADGVMEAALVDEGAASVAANGAVVPHALHTSPPAMPATSQTSVRSLRCGADVGGPVTDTVHPRCR